MHNQKIILGVSCGDVNGIGLEILIKTFIDKTLFDFFTPVLYVPSEILTFYIQSLELDQFKYNIVNDINHLSSTQLNIVSWSGNDQVVIKPGTPDPRTAPITISSLDMAIEHWKKKKTDVLVTLPVNKFYLSTPKKEFVGHTEYLLNHFPNKENLMFLCAEDLRIATVTNHIPILKVPFVITKELLVSKINILMDSLKLDFMISKPKLAILGLNPHAGDGGLIGCEEKQIIEPVVESFYKLGDLVFGPYSADGFFGSGNYKHFDAVLGMYHDQALIPFKTISFGRGVNYTAGLPRVRVSPDHGVGYDIVGKGVSKTDSFISSLFLARDIYENRSVVP